jgi:hypothetical protein
MFLDMRLFRILPIITPEAVDFTNYLHNQRAVVGMWVRICNRWRRRVIIVWWWKDLGWWWGLVVVWSMCNRRWRGRRFVVVWWWRRW